MTAPNPHRDAHRENAEWQFLAAVCDAALPVSSRSELCRKTPPSTFANVACRTVFEEILAMTKREKPHSPQALRDELPACVTRRGFPDLDFDLLFSCGKDSGNASAEGPEAHLARTYEALMEIAVRENKS